MLSLYVALQRALWRAQRGQGMVEYALILVLVAVVVIATLTLLGSKISSAFSYITGQLNT